MWTRLLIALQAVRSKAALNWMAKTIDIITAPPLFDQLKQYDEVHRKRTERLTQMEIDLKEVLHAVQRIEDKLGPIGADEGGPNG